MPGTYIQEGPYIELDGSGNESLAGPREQYPGKLTDLDQKVRDCQVFSDGVAHNMCPFTIMPDRTVEIRVSVRAQRTSNGDAAYLDDVLFVRRIGNAAPQLIAGGAGVLGFLPNTGTWNTSTAVPALSGNDAVYAVTSPNLPLIRWTVCYVVVGSQAK